MPTARGPGPRSRRCSATIRDEPARVTCSSAATRSWCGCSTATAPSWASRRCRPSSKPPPRRRSASCSEDTATVSIAAPQLAGGTLSVRRRRAEPDRPQVPDRLSRRAAPGCTSPCATRRAATVFESGAIDAAGAIHGNDNDADAAEVRAALRRDHEPGSGADLRADPRRPRRTCRRRGCSRRRSTSRTTGCCRADSTRRRPTPRSASTARRAQDADFAGGGDRVRYAVAVPPAAGRSTVDVELRYQPIGYRWAHNLEKLRRARAEALRRLLQRDVGGVVGGGGEDGGNRTIG